MTWTAIRASLAAAVLALCVVQPASAGCSEGQFEGVPFTACTVDPATEELRMWLRDPDGDILGTFGRLRELVSEEGAELGFAMNAGMFHDDRAPVGHYLENGREERRVITSAGPGNFGMLPNGVFCVGGNWAKVIESRAYRNDEPDCRYATQSGPLLVIDGALHPRFLPDSSSRYVRNGVGVRADGTVVAAISDQAVNFHTFARLFRDHLDTPNALYLDGNVSKLYSPELGRSGAGLPVGPILGTVIRND